MRGEAWIIDADGHAMEPRDLWNRYLPEEFRSFALRLDPKFDDMLYAIPGGVDPQRRLADMDTDGIERSYVFPTIGLGVQGVIDPVAGPALCRAINDWMADYCAASPERIRGVGAIPSISGDEALREAMLCIEERGLAGVFRRPELYSGVLPIHDPSFDDLYAYLESVGKPILIHSGFNPFVPLPYFTERFGDSTTACHAALFPIEAMMALTSFALYGVLDRHPRLRVGFVECGAVWAHSYVHRLDEHVEKWPALLGADVSPGVRLERLPSEAFAEQCFVSVEEVEPGLALMVERFPKSVVFASDYPHPDATFPGAPARLLGTDQLTADQIRAICRDNPLALYGG